VYFIGLFLSSADGGGDGGMKDIAFAIPSGDCVFIEERPITSRWKKGGKQRATDGKVCSAGIWDKG
jgi:hypothetical protein